MYSLPQPEHLIKQTISVAVQSILDLIMNGLFEFLNLISLHSRIRGQVPHALLLHFVSLRFLSSWLCKVAVLEVNLALDSICFILGGWRLLLISLTLAMALFILGLASRSEIVFLIT